MQPGQSISTLSPDHLRMSAYTSYVTQETHWFHGLQFSICKMGDTEQQLPCGTAECYHVKFLGQPLGVRRATNSTLLSKLACFSEPVSCDQHAHHLQLSCWKVGKEVKVSGRSGYGSFWCRVQGSSWRLQSLLLLLPRHTCLGRWRIKHTVRAFSTRPGHRLKHSVTCCCVLSSGCQIEPARCSLRRDWSRWEIVSPCTE